MKVVALIAVVALSATVAVDANPLAKVFELVDGLKQRIRADGEKEDQAFKKFTDFCRTTAKDVQNEIGTSSGEENKLKSKVTKLESDIGVGDTKVADLGASVAKAESELKGATSIRKKEAEEFAEGEQTLITTVSTLERALSTLEKQLSAGKSFAQLDESALASLVQTLSVVDDAAALDGSSMDALTALVQAHDEDGDEETGAPAAGAYKKQSGGIMEILEDMKDKADGQLADLRNNEMQAKNSYNLLRQGLQDSIAAEQKELSDTRSAKAEAAEEKASGESNLAVTQKETVTSQKKNEDVTANCQTSANDHEANAAARVQELKVIGEAEQILRESTSGAASFLQVSAGSTQKATARQLASAAVIRMVENLAKNQHSASLAQLASRVSAELKYGAARHSADPFKKVKDLVNSMISKLEKEASADATEKAYCDEEMSKTKDKKSELEDSVTKLSAKIGKSASQSSQLKEEVSELMSELSVLTKEQAKMDTIRREAAAAHSATKQDLEQGLGGVRKALSVLRDFYGSEEAAFVQEDADGDHDDMAALMQRAKQPAPPQQFEKSTGAGTGIINLLEVVESDLAKNLATEDTEESDSQSNYEKQTQENKINKAEKEQAAKFKTQEFKSLDKSLSELAADKATAVDEFTAVSDYYGKVKERCVAKPTPYEELKARRDAEIQGLKDALASIESEALMQVGARRQKRSSLRGDALRTDGDDA